MPSALIQFLAVLHEGDLQVEADAGADAGVLGLEVLGLVLLLLRFAGALSGFYAHGILQSRLDSADCLLVVGVQLLEFRGDVAREFADLRGESLVRLHVGGDVQLEVFILVGVDPGDGSLGLHHSSSGIEVTGEEHGGEAVVLAVVDSGHVELALLDEFSVGGFHAESRHDADDAFLWRGLLLLAFGIDVACAVEVESRLDLRDLYGVEAQRLATGIGVEPSVGEVAVAALVGVVAAVALDVEEVAGHLEVQHAAVALLVAVGRTEFAADLDTGGVDVECGLAELRLLIAEVEVLDVRRGHDGDGRRGIHER